MRLIDADELLDHLYNGVEYDRTVSDGIKKTDENIYAYKCGWNEALKSASKWSPTVDAVPLEDYKSMEQTVNKLTKAIADAESVKHGYWVNKGFEPVRCSVCGITVDAINGIPWAIKSFNYCPHCGAKMDEVKDGKAD